MNKNSKYLIFSTSEYFMTSAVSRYDVKNLTLILYEFEILKLNEILILFPRFVFWLYARWSSANARQ